MEINCMSGAEVEALSQAAATDFEMHDRVQLWALDLEGLKRWFGVNLSILP